MEYRMGRTANAARFFNNEFNLSTEFNGVSNTETVIVS
jgi:hypothetical protein